MKILKFSGFLFLILGFVLTTLPLYPVFLFLPSFTRHLLVQIVSLYSKLMLYVLRIKVDFKNFEFSKLHENYLVVGNHLSYTDVLILASHLPSCFVTSQEIKAAPFLGQLASLSGCLFVDRKDRSQLKNEINELRMALKDGLNVTVFPEATSTNGDGVLKFKKPLFESSLATGKPILPLTINYRLISGKNVTIYNRDVVCWYGDMEFFPHLMTLLEQHEIKVEVTLHEPFLPELMPSVELASKSFDLVSNDFRPLNTLTRETL